MKILLQLSIFISLMFLFSCSDEKKKEAAFSHQLDSLEGHGVITASKYEKLTYTEAYNKSLKLWQTSFEEKDIKTTMGNCACDYMRTDKCSTADSPAWYECKFNNVVSKHQGTFLLIQSIRDRLFA